MVHGIVVEEYIHLHKPRLYSEKAVFCFINLKYSDSCLSDFIL